jgi:succinate dehydrogenase/fumarate reductase cytochrome b subunit
MQAEYGPDAYPSILHRVSSVALLLGLVVVIGIAAAGAVGTVILVAGFLLEQAISS